LLLLQYNTFDNMKYKWVLLIVTSIITYAVTAQKDVQQFTFKHRWVDSVYKTLTLEERVGQLFMVAAYSGGENKNQQHIEGLLKKHHIGGIIFMQGTAEAQAKLTNQYQKVAHMPLLVAMDAEWGLGMRLTGVKDLPKQMTIGASQSDTLMLQIGTAVAAQCKRLGVHINFAPTIDVNNNPKNPVIGFRSFGSNKALVSKMGIAYAKALQNNGVMACAKHFPGHGDVTVDSHKDLPIINKNKATLQALELYPFQQLIDNGVQSIMIAHLNLPLIDTAKVPSTLSHKIVTEILQQEMGFEGLIFTDALDMKGVSKYYAQGEVELLAFLAGNDVLLFSQNVELAVQKIVFAYVIGKVTEERLAHSVKKILAAKYDKGLYNYVPVNEKHVTEDLNAAYENIMQLTAVQSATLVKDKYKNISKFASAKTIAFVTFNANAQQVKMYKAHYPNAVFINMDDKQDATMHLNTIQKLPKDAVIVSSLHKLSRYPGEKEYYGYTEEQMKVVKTIASNKKSIIILYGVPYFAQHFCHTGSLLVAYEDNYAFQNNIIRILEGGIQAQGVLPVSICE
jgi:beta-N-acetylhexosaminidase